MIYKINSDDLKPAFEDALNHLSIITTHQSVRLANLIMHGMLGDPRVDGYDHTLPDQIILDSDMLQPDESLTDPIPINRVRLVYKAPKVGALFILWHASIDGKPIQIISGEVTIDDDHYRHIPTMDEVIKDHKLRSMRETGDWDPRIQRL